MSSNHNTASIGITDFPGEHGFVTRVIELRRPDKLNCLNLEMLAQLQRATAATQAHRIIITGAGRAFCSGLDLVELQAAKSCRPHLESLVHLYQWFLETETETIALVRGHAAGGGIGLAACFKSVIACADLRVRVPAGDLARLASVVLPVLNLRAGHHGQPPGGWLGCDLDSTEALRLGLADRAVSESEFEEFMTQIRRGAVSPKLQPQRKYDERAIKRAKEELDGFIESFCDASPHK